MQGWEWKDAEQTASGWTESANEMEDLCLVQNELMPKVFQRAMLETEQRKAALTRFRRGGGALEVRSEIVRGESARWEQMSEGDRRYDPRGRVQC